MVMVAPFGSSGSSGLSIVPHRARGTSGQRLSSRARSTGGFGWLAGWAATVGAVVPMATATTSATRTNISGP